MLISAPGIFSEKHWFTQSLTMKSIFRQYAKYLRAVFVLVLFSRNLRSYDLSRQSGYLTAPMTLILNLGAIEITMPSARSFAVV